MKTQSHTRSEHFGLSRRELFAGVTMACATTALTTSTALFAQVSASTSVPGSALARQWISSSRAGVWQDLSKQLTFAEGRFGSIMVKLDDRFQQIDGFGACFNELGWDALQLLTEDARRAVMADFFAPASADNFGLGFNHCRMPIGATDLSRGWYSHNEVAGDFAMANFSIARDKEALIPFIKAAKALQPNLSLWASPWSPPTWMKTNGHYAQRPDPKFNDLPPEKTVKEGQDGFITQDRYFKAYALYFRKFTEAYRAEGIPISMVMPQNEFSSNQIFPSCVWTPEMLARFIGHLGDALRPVDVEIFLGTLERDNPELVHRAMKDKKARGYIKGLGCQWAGRHSMAGLHDRYPNLKIMHTEQECGDGKNDWRFARHGWEMMRDFMNGGSSVYNYWNFALPKGGTSSWGWKQNSLVLVDPATRTFEYTLDYYMLKHVAHFVHPGAQRVRALSWSGYEHSLAFVNADGREVVVIANDQPEPMPVAIAMRGSITKAVLPANSLNTVAG